MTTENNLIVKVNNWIKHSVTLKLIIITVLSMMLLAPTFMIRGIIGEREQQSKQATLDVSSKWANQQQITGPILSIPVFVNEPNASGSMIPVKKIWHLLPDQLEINGDIKPEKLSRGIYEVMVYESMLNVSGTFNLENHPESKLLQYQIMYDQAFITIGISDLRGIKNQIIFNWDHQPYSVQPGSKIPDMVKQGINIDLPVLEDQVNQGINFDFKLLLRGSQNLSFTPLGNTTQVALNSTWEAPSFNGNFLPDERVVNENGFTASWQVLELNRNYPQAWLAGEQVQKITDSAFGVDLLVPLDNYQKSMRSVKYAIITIALTFLVFFVVEIRHKGRIHPFQYILVGLALCLFYILLLAIAEHTSFNLAYLISSLSIIGMVTIYSLSVFQERKLTLILLLTLAATYAFLFVILQLTDYALLMGSIGLVVILATTMYLTRKIDWYRIIEPDLP